MTLKLIYNILKKEICRLYNIDHKQLDRFILNYENYKNEKNKHNKKTFHKGCKTNFSDEEQKIILDIVDSALANFTPINYMLVTQIIQKKFKTLENLSFHSIYLRIERFLKSQFYVSRKAIHIGQSIPNDAINLCFKFLREIIDKRKFNNYALSDIINCDETPIFLDSPSSLTLAKKREKLLLLKHMVKKILE